MICQRCLFRAARRNSPLHIAQRRRISSTTLSRAQEVTAQETTATNPRPNDLPAATSTSAAQPFSEPLNHSPQNIKDLPIDRKQKKDAAKVQSSVPAGTVLKGLNFMKNAQDPIAMEDSEYPAWLWGVLDKVKEGKGDGAEEQGDLFSKSKKQRRLAAKRLRKQQMMNPDMLQPKIPIYEQSVDLPAGDGTLEGAKGAGEARGQLTKAMRDKRRAKIKEGNFLKAMG